MKGVPRVGFVSLGCPKALVDSERILTQLRAEGYATAKDMKVLVDAPGVSRSSADAPEIDGVVRFRASGNFNIGDFVQIMIERSDEHDLFGRPA